MKTKKIIAIASAGGHWVQLLRLVPAMNECDITFVTTNAGLRHNVRAYKFRTVHDANMWNKFALLCMAVQIMRIIILIRPNIVISTGAAPGYFALMFGKLIGAKTIWIDSIANSEELSLAGKKAKRWATHWLTQWPELAKEDGPHYLGSVL